MKLFLKLSPLPLLVVLFLCIDSYGHQNQTDSLLQLLSHQKEDTQKVNLLNKIGRGYYQLSRYDSALLYVHEARSLAVETHFQKGEATAISLAGITLYELGDFAGALKHYYEALIIVEQLKEEKAIATIYNDIGNIYRKKANYPQSLAFHYKALKIRRKLKDDRGIAMSLLNMATVYKNQKKYNSALRDYDSAFDICHRIGDQRGMAFIYNNMGNLYIELGKYEIGLKMHFLNIKLCREMGDITGIAWSENNIGETYMMMGKAALSRRFLQKSLAAAQATGSKEIIQNVYLNLSKLSIQSKDYKSAYKNYQQYIVYRDSIYNESQASKMTRIAMSYEYNKQEELLKLNQEQSLKHTRLWYSSLSIIAALLAILGFALFYVLRMKKAKEIQLMTIQQQVSDLKYKEVKNELVTVKHGIAQFVKSINDKNKIIGDIQKELNTLKIQHPEIDDKLSSLRNIHILTDDDWMSFLSNFSRLYPRFTITIKEKYPKITNSELRYLMLTKIGLLHKEMADVLGVSNDTIRVTWNRVRKKLQGTIDDTPQSLLHKLDVDER